MKLLVVGQKQEFRFEHQIAFELEKHFQVYYFDPEKYTESIKYKIFDRLDKISFFRNFYFLRLNNNFFRAVKLNKPDLIIIFSLNFIMPRTLKKIKKHISSKIFIFFTDNPINKKYSYSYRYETIKIAKISDRYFVISRLIKKYLKYHYKINSLNFQFYYSDRLMPKTNSKHIYDIVFIGNLDSRRVEILNYISKYFVINIWCENSFHKKNLNKNIIIHQSVYGKDYSNVISKSKICLNILREHNIKAQSVNMRDYEILGLKKVLLRDYTIDGYHYLKKYNNCFFFKEKSEIPKTLSKLLKHNIEPSNLHVNSPNDLANDIMEEYYKLI